VARLSAVLERLDGSAEVLLVDDGSTDESWATICALHDRDERYRAVRLSRNFGHQAAITAGMDLARGDAVVVMDADLQDPPEVVLEMSRMWRSGNEVVYGVREDRTTDSALKRWTATVFYRLLSSMSEVDIPQDVGDFRLVDRRAVEAFKQMREGNRFVRGMYAWMGFRQVGVPYRREARHAGETKYPLRNMLRFATDGIVGFSQVPLRLASRLGVLFALLAIIGGLSAVLVKLAGTTVPGWTSILLAVTLLGGLQLAVLGVIGQYLGRTYEESLRRPLYIVDDVCGLDTPAHLPARAVVLQHRPPRRDLLSCDGLLVGEADEHDESQDALEQR
jgi:dolichol-phosphate mannosyltransferase